MTETIFISYILIGIVYGAIFMAIAFFMKICIDKKYSTTSIPFYEETKRRRGIPPPIPYKYTHWRPLLQFDFLTAFGDDNKYPLDKEISKVSDRLNCDLEYVEKQRMELKKWCYETMLEGYDMTKLQKSVDRICEDISDYKHDLQIVADYFAKLSANLKPNDPTLINNRLYQFIREKVPARRVADINIKTKEADGELEKMVITVSLNKELSQLVREARERVPHFTPKRRPTDKKE